MSESRYRNLPATVEPKVYPSPIDTAINASVVSKYDVPPTADSVRAALEHWRADMYGHVGNEIPVPEPLPIDPDESEPIDPVEPDSSVVPPVDASVTPSVRRWPRLGHQGWLSTKDDSSE